MESRDRRLRSGTPVRRGSMRQGRGERPWAVTFYVPESENVMYADAAAILARTKAAGGSGTPLILSS